MDALTQTRSEQIIRQYKLASKLERKAGLDWYPQAREFSERLFPADVLIGAAVVAVLSPRIPWEENQDAATTLVRAFNQGSTIIPIVAGFPANALKAWKILNREYPVSPMDLMSKPPAFKVNNFYRNILGDTQAVTVDYLTACIAEPSLCGQEISITGKRYIGIERAYQVASETLKTVTPRDLQAITWLSARI